MVAKDLKRHGLRLGFEKDPGGPGWEYAVYDDATDALLVSGWTLGSKADARAEALDDARRIVARREATAATGAA